MSTNVKICKEFISENRIGFSLAAFEWRINNRNEVH